MKYILIALIVPLLISGTVPERVTLKNGVLITNSPDITVINNNNVIVVKSLK